MIELFKDFFRHFDLIVFKESDIIQFNEMVFETNEFGRFKLKEGGYNFTNDTVGMLEKTVKLTTTFQSKLTTIYRAI